MSMINSIILEGVVVEDATLFEVTKDFSVCKFQIEVTRKLMHDDKEVSKFNIEGFGDLGKRLHSKAKKDKKIRIVGRLKEENQIGITDALHPEPVTITKIYVVAEHFYIIPETYF